MAKIIKLKNKGNQISKLKEDLKQEHSKAQKERKKKTPKELQWKKKKVENWKQQDFFYFYLHCYEKYFEEKDIMYIGNAEIHKEKAKIRYFLKTYCDDDKTLLKRYIRWAVKWGASDECWMDNFGFWNVFSRKPYLFKLYKSRDRKKTLKRIKKDISWSSSDSWEDYYKNKEDD